MPQIIVATGAPLSCMDGIAAAGAAALGPALDLALAHGTQPGCGGPAGRADRRQKQIESRPEQLPGVATKLRVRLWMHTLGGIRRRIVRLDTPDSRRASSRPAGFLRAHAQLRQA